jgi:hypothetical protein
MMSQWRLVHWVEYANTYGLTALLLPLQSISLGQPDEMIRATKPAHSQSHLVRA